MASLPLLLGSFGQAAMRRIVTLTSIKCRKMLIWRGIFVLGRNRCAWISTAISCPIILETGTGIETTNGYLASLTENVMSVPTSEKRIQDLLAVGYYAAAKPRFNDQQLLYQGSHNLNIYLNPGAFPRAWAVHQIKGVPLNTDLGNILMQPDNDLRQIAFSSANTSGGALLQSCPGVENVSVIRHRSSEVWIEASLQCRGMVILADTYYPGWKAWVDGRSAPIREVDGMLRGVVVEAGNHKIEMRYQPWSIRLGALFTFLGLVGSLSASFLRI